MTGVMVAVATRIVRRGRCHWEAWTLERYEDDPGTDIWFYVGRAWSKRGARRTLRTFLTDRTSW